MSEAQEKLKKVQESIAETCQKRGREPNEVHLIAVSKTHPIAKIQAMYDAGQRRFGENKVQELEQKVPQLPSDIEWHLIGHLQSNKVNKAVKLVSWIHSVDSAELLQKINRTAGLLNKKINVFLEVNVSGEASKDGMKVENVHEVLLVAQSCNHIVLQGFMTMAPLDVDVNVTRQTFRCLRELREKWSTSTSPAMRELSMGMSGDYTIAIEEGSTYIRVGTALFAERDYPHA